jgi:hypothetical protein
MRSLLGRTPAVTPISELPGCEAGRTETVRVIRKGGRLYRMVIRDKVVVEDPYLMMVKAEAYSIKTGTENAAKTTPRSIRDVLIKSNVGVI